MPNEVTNLIDKPDCKEVYDLLDSLLLWYPEIKYRLNDAERAIFEFIIERANRILTQHDEAQRK